MIIQYLILHKKTTSDPLQLSMSWDQIYLWLVYYHMPNKQFEIKFVYAVPLMTVNG